jgi:hypothetical protein
MIQALVEYLPLNRSDSARYAKYEIFNAAPDEVSNHYLSKIKELTRGKSGIYIFYDSVGRAIYVGKAREQSLWAEVNLAYNRDRGDHQELYAVKHPTRNFRENRLDRKIQRLQFYLHDIARYISVYEVEKGFVDNMEAFLIRAFANGLMNGRIENFKVPSAG